MNDLNGRIVPDTSTAHPPAYNTWQAADKDTLMNAVLMFEEANKKLNKENIALRADMAKLEAENAELRKKCMTNMECIQTADEYDLAAMLLGIHGWGYTDAYQEGGGSPFFDFDSPEDVIHWLKRTEWD